MPWFRAPFLLLLTLLLIVTIPHSRHLPNRVSYIPEFAASVQAMGANRASIRLVTYNIHHGAGLDGRVDLSRVAATLRDTDADIIFLSEVDYQWRRSGYADQAAVLANMLEMPYTVFVPALTRRGIFRTSSYGNALLSRFPIESVERQPLPVSPWQEPRVALSALVRLPGGTPLRVIGTHLGLHQADRVDQAAVLKELGTADENEYLVLMGDFNAYPDSPELELLLSHWSDPLMGEKLPATFPAQAPRSRIDYILVSQNLQSGVGLYDSPHSDASDHLPVLAELSLGEIHSH